MQWDRRGIIESRFCREMSHKDCSSKQIILHKAWKENVDHLILGTCSRCQEKDPIHHLPMYSFCAWYYSGIHWQIKYGVKILFSDHQISFKQCYSLIPPSTLNCSLWLSWPKQTISITNRCGDCQHCMWHQFPSQNWVDPSTAQPFTGRFIWINTRLPLIVTLPPLH